MATDLFIDASATGTGSGDTPANACTQIINNSLMVAGVRAWVRRTHVESGNGGNLGPNINDFVKNHRGWIIGWPSSGDPFYEIRPAAGISAGWDSDHSALGIYTTYGLDFPTICASGNLVGPTLTYGTVLANMNIDQLSANGAFRTLTRARPSAFMENVAFTCQQGPVTSMQLDFVDAHMGRMWLISSGAGFGTNNDFYIDELIVHSLTTNSGGLMLRPNANVMHQINLLVNYSSSIDFLFFDQGGTMFDRAQIMNGIIGRVCGVKPYSGAFLPTINGFAYDEAYRIDDWFGEGPMIGSKWGPRVSLAASADAMYNNARALFITVQSWNHTDQAVGARAMFTYPMRKLFDVTSGSAITVYVPIYVDSTAVWSLSAGDMKMRLRAAGCGGTIITSAHVLPGSTTFWGGAKLGGGVAYHLVNTFVPTEDASVPLEIFLPVLTLSEAIGYGGYMLWGEPWAVQ